MAHKGQIGEKKGGAARPATDMKTVKTVCGKP